MVTSVRQTHHDGCTRDGALVILSSMAVCERRSPGVFVVTTRLLANGWSRVGAAPLVVGREGKWVDLYDAEGDAEKSATVVDRARTVFATTGRSVDFEKWIFEER